MQLILDSRETFLNDELLHIGCPFTTRQLPVGDVVFQISNEMNEIDEETDQPGEKSNSVPVLICERKTGNDFLCSIKGGRYSEQRERLKPLINSGVKIVYIVEGYHELNKTSVFNPLLSKTKATDLAIVGGAIENLILYHDIYVLPTLSTAHTAKTLYNILKKLEKEPLHTTISVPITLTPKKEKILDNIHEQQMLLIPGVSPTVVKAIRERYPTLRSLIKAYDEMNNEIERETMLSEISLGKRKLGKVLSKRIHDIYSK